MSFFTFGCSLFGIESVEEAPYQAVVTDNKFEVREYEPLVFVETQVDGNFKEAGSKSFRRLFGYITGDNEGNEKIAMTAPVVSEPQSDAEGEVIAMTAPVVSEQDGDSWRYRFVLPKSFTIETAPKPTNPLVQLVATPSQRVAALRFSGLSSQSKRAEKKAALQSWIQEQGLTATSEPRWAGYNSPWAIPWFRRNEILIDVE